MEKDGSRLTISRYPPEFSIIIDLKNYYYTLISLQGERKKPPELLIMIEFSLCSYRSYYFKQENDYHIRMTKCYTFFFKHFTFANIFLSV